MALFKMRDSWNVWRRKVDDAIGGTVEPIESANVEYDNTDSGLTATNVQSAIDEVAEKTSNCKIVSFDNLVETTGTGTETYGELLDVVVASFRTVISGLEDNQYVLPKRLTIYGVTSILLKPFYWDKTATAYDLAGINLGITDTGLTNWFFSAPQAGCILRKATTTFSTGDIALEDTSSVTPASGRRIGIMYDVYEKLV